MEIALEVEERPVDTLEKFMQSQRKRTGWVRYDVFSVYIRKPFGCFPLTLANVISLRPGSGRFWKLVETLESYGPLKIESVLNQRLARSLRKRGWVENGDEFCPDFTRRVGG